LVGLNINKFQQTKENLNVRKLIFVVYVDEARLCLRTVATNRHIFHSSDDMSMEHWWNDTDREKPKNSEENLSMCHYVHYRPHMD
jgi:hypothetical protein